MTDRSRWLRPRNVWIGAFVLGAAAALLAVLTGFIGFVFVLLVVPGLGGRTWLAGMSGVLVGFGGTWLLLARPDGNQLGATIWLLVGGLPLVIGGVLGLVALVVAGRNRG